MRFSPLRFSVCLSVSVLMAAATFPVRASAGGMGEVVKAFCLSAFENEMAQAGKHPPAGMASFACGCVADRITGGSSIETARSSCREATARRYPI